MSNGEIYISDRKMKKKKVINFSVNLKVLGTQVDGWIARHRMKKCKKIDLGFFFSDLKKFNCRRTMLS